MASFIPGGEEDNEYDDFFFDDDVEEANLPAYKVNENVKKTPEITPVPRKFTLEEFRFAVTRNDVNTVKQCLQQGLSVDAVLKSGWSMLMYAANSANPDVVAFLLENGANANYETNKYSVLMAACGSNDKTEVVFECVRLLVEHGAEVNHYDRYHLSPLLYAAREGQVEVLKYLLDHGASINKQDSRGWTALSWATHRNQVQVVKLLMTQGCNSQLKHTDGLLPLDIAIGQDNEILIGVLDGKTTSKLVGGESTSRVNGINTNKSPERKAPILQNGSGDNAAQTQIKDSNYSFSTSSKVCFNTIRDSLDKHHVDSSASDSPSQQKDEITVPTLPVSSSDYVKFGELELFLCGLGFNDLVELFQQQHVTFDIFLCLNEEDLINMGIKQIGVRKKIIEGIQAVHKREWQPSSLITPKYKSTISCSEAVAMVSNISSHLLYISSSIVYINDQIKKAPELLVNTQGNIGPKQLVRQTTDTLTNVTALKSHITQLNKRLQKELKLIDDHIDLPDLIKKTKPRKHCGFKLAMSVVVMTAAGLVMWKRDSVQQFVTNVINDYS